MWNGLSLTRDSQKVPGTACRCQEISPNDELRLKRIHGHIDFICRDGKSFYAEGVVAEDNLDAGSSLRGPAQAQHFWWDDVPKSSMNQSLRVIEGPPMRTLDSLLSCTTLCLHKYPFWKIR